MRYRRSREIRQRLNTGSPRIDRGLRLVLLGLGLLTVVGWGGWTLIFSNDSSSVVSWLLNRPIQLGRSVDTRTAPYKSAQEQYRINDFAIAQALTNLQVKPNHVKDADIWRLESNGTWSPTHRTIRVSSFYSLTQCNLEFARSITAVGGAIVRADENSRNHELSLQVAFGTLLTHELTIIRDGTIQRQVGHMAIIIDALGSGHGKLAQQFLRINKPLTFALVPWQSESVRLASEAIRHHQEIIVHLPMEPKSYPRISPGKRAVLVNQTEQRNRRVVQEALAVLSDAQGVKNHMGSRATENRDVMRVVLDEVKRSGKYFIDSRTSNRSIAHSFARQLGIRSAASWGFLDAIDNQERIATMLDLASYAALEHGPVIVIGHARPNTLAVLQQNLDRLILRGIQLVHVSTLVPVRHEEQPVDSHEKSN